MDSPNKNRRIYTREVILHAMAHAPKELLVHKHPYEQLLTDIVGVVRDLWIVDDFLEGNYYPIDSVAGETVVAGLENGSLSIVSSGTGQCADFDDKGNTIISDYRITSCIVTDDPSY